MTAAYGRSIARLRRLAIASLVLMSTGVAIILAIRPRLEQPVRGQASLTAALLLGVGFIGLLLAAAVTIPLVRARRLDLSALRSVKGNPE